MTTFTCYYLRKIKKILNFFVLKPNAWMTIEKEKEDPVGMNRDRISRATLVETTKWYRIYSG